MTRITEYAIEKLQYTLLPKLMSGEVLVKLDQGNLFSKEGSVITKHIKNIFSSSELDEKSNVQKMHFTHFDKGNRWIGNYRGLLESSETNIFFDDEIEDNSVCAFFAPTV